MTINEVIKLIRRRHLAALIIHNPANLRALTSLECDNAVLVITAKAGEVKLYTDFRYAAAFRRQASWLKVRDLKRLELKSIVDAGASRVGLEFTEPHRFVEKLRALLPRQTKLVDISADLLSMRSVKSEEEIRRIKAAQRLNHEIFAAAVRSFRAGMTERTMARIIKRMMLERGEGEAFETIVCVGANAAECHHVPDDTVWNGREGVLIDMGVKLDGYCSDMTRCIRPKRRSALYRKVDECVRRAHDAAIAAAAPGVTAGRLDAIARRIIREGGFGRCFGHSLGHGVGLEIHEEPTARRGSKTILKPGMFVTIEPGVYLEGNLGLRLEDLILITPSGCEVVL